mmetsp:Transcript_1160/g.2169  ORF Transcript_1160/g.2169 Transcript_1160/m.2169 type:complete len:597 (+) Transcript_1160:25-1815(+)
MESSGPPRRPEEKKSELAPDVASTTKKTRVDRQASATIGTTSREEVKDKDAREHLVNKPLLDRLWQAPVLRQVWGVEQESEKIDWFELFYDLIYVALAINLSNFLASNSNGEGIATAVIYFAMLFFAWNSLTIFVSRFHQVDMFATIMQFIYSAVVVSMAIYVLEPIRDSAHKFSFAFLVSRGCLVAMYGQVALLVPRARVFGKIAVIGNTMSAILFAIATIDAVPTGATIILWLLAAYPVELGWMTVMYTRPEASLPINVEHMSERYGLFVMLMLGESVIAIVTDATKTRSQDWVIIFCGFLLVYTNKLLYFESQPHQPEQHALRQATWRGRIYQYTHMVLGMSLVGIGTGIKLLKKDVDYSKHHATPTTYRLLTYSLVVFHVSNNIIRLTHKFKNRSLLIWATRLVFIVIIGLFPVMAPEIEPWVLPVAYALFNLCLTLIDAGSGVVKVPDKKQTYNEDRLPPKVLVLVLSRHGTRTRDRTAKTWIIYGWLHGVQCTRREKGQNSVGSTHFAALVLFECMWRERNVVVCASCYSRHLSIQMTFFFVLFFLKKEGISCEGDALEHNPLMKKREQKTRIHLRFSRPFHNKNKNEKN